MKTVLSLLLLLQSFTVPPRATLENPAAVTAIPKAIQKDYDKLWTQFLAAKSAREDSSVAGDVSNMLKKNKDFAPLIILQAYQFFYTSQPAKAEPQFAAVLAKEPENRIALYFLAEMAYSRSDYLRAGDFYTRLFAVDRSHPEAEPKRQKSLLLAANNLLSSASEAEEKGRLADTEQLYREALLRAPLAASLHGQLAGVLTRQRKWGEALAEFQRQIELGGPNAEAQRQIVAALTNLGRLDEARALSDRIGGAGPRDVDQLLSTRELEDLGRWGPDISQFRAIQSAASITREQLAALLVRYFPQISELPRREQVLVDTQDSWAGSEIRTVVGLGILDPTANHAFQPSRNVTRGEFAVALSRLTHVVGATGSSKGPIATTDVASSNAVYQDVQLVLGYGLLSLDKAGNFGTDEPVTGKEAVNAGVQLIGFPQSFQQPRP